MVERLETVSGKIVRARGALSNVAGRFERYGNEGFDDGWEPDASLPTLRTEVREEIARSVITRNASPDIAFDRSLNPYRGCEHGCVYCFARPTHAYLGLSPGLDFETKLAAKVNAPEVLARELRRKGYRPEVIALGTSTDPYQPEDKTRRITRRILGVLSDFRHPVGVVTKGALVERDADILGEMGRAGLARVGISITTLDPGLARRLEPRCPTPARRLAAIRALTEAGCPVRVMVSPVLPGLTDHEIEDILDAARDAGAQAASWVMLRLPREVSPLVQEWLAEHAPARAGKVMARLREMHGGRDYDPEWGRRMRGEGPHAEMIAHRFKLAVRRIGLAEELPPLRTDLFTVPKAPGDQLELF